MDTHVEIDSSWDNALNLVHEALGASNSLARLIQMSWLGGLSAQAFLNGMQANGVSPARLMRAARIHENPVPDINAAVGQLGLKRSAIVLAVQVICASTVEQRQADESWMPILRELINYVEIGYHFGICADRIGPDYGMLIGFAHYLGTSLLLAARKQGSTDSTSCQKALMAPEYLSQEFGCEPFQVSSLALQRLGFGPELAATAALALGRLHNDSLTIDPLVKDWSAASDWILALRIGERTPNRKSSRERYHELIPPDADIPLPTHLEILHAQMQEIRENDSSWYEHFVVKPDEHMSTRVSDGGNSVPLA